MAAAPAAAVAPGAAPAEAAPAKKKGKLLFIIIGAVAAAVLVVGGGATYFLMKKSGSHSEQKHAEAAKPPVFHPLDTFTVNLADRDRERFLQVVVSLQVKDAHVAERIKAFNPIVRDRILRLLSSQTADQVATPEGKEKLARAIVTAINRIIADELGADTPLDDLPVQSALFSSFVVQ